MTSLLAAPLEPFLVFAVTVMAVTPLVPEMMAFAVMLVAPLVPEMMVFAVMMLAMVSPMPVVAWVVMAAVTSPSQIRTSRVGPRIIIRIGLMVSKPESRRSIRAIGY